jgi:putative ABC transport system permease protein
VGAPRASRLRALAAKLHGALRGHRDDEFDQEMQEHLRLLTDRFIADGLSRDEAARAARRQFGNVTRLQEDRRAMQTLPSIEVFWRDFRYALRVLWKDRGFAAVSIATLGLGIGAATIIFSVVNNVLLAPFPYQGADRMLFPRIYDAQSTPVRQGYKAVEALALIEDTHVFDGVVAALGETILYRHGAGTDSLNGARVTPGTFEFFGMPALHGRVLQPGDYEPGAPPVFVMRYKTWRERFNGDESLVNQTLILNGTARTLVGVMPPRFGWYGADVLIPEKLTPDAAGNFWFVLGRMKPGVSIEQTTADVTLVTSRLAKILPQDYPANFSVRAVRLIDSVVDRVDAFKATLYTVLAAVGLLLLIACANVANLMLARATTRAQEFAVRMVLGAGRARLTWLTMIESLVLATAGAVLGLFLASAGLQTLVATLPPFVIPSEAVIGLNTPVLIFTLCLTVLTTLIFGLAPALRSSRGEANNSLRDGGRSVIGGIRARRLRDAVVVMEVALSLTLLIGAGLLTRSFAALRSVDLGVQVDHVFLTGLRLPVDRYKPDERGPRFFEPLLARVKALPGVVDATISSNVPPYGGPDSRVEVAGKGLDDTWRMAVQRVSEGYFRVLRLSFKQGRPFTEAEVNSARRVAVVNETFARRYLSGESALGRRVRAPSSGSADSGNDSWFEIVGVVTDVVNRGLRAPIEPEVWIPYTIGALGQPALMVRTSQDPASIGDAVRREVWAIDAGATARNDSTLERSLDEVAYAGPRFGLLVMTLFGGIGLMLVTVGVYSVLAYSTAQRTREIGIRMALGAEAMDALGLVVKSGLRLVGVGVAIGVAASLLLSRVLETQLVGVTSYDMWTFVATALLLLTTAAIACWIPARRAARVDPLVALRYE